MRILTIFLLALGHIHASEARNIYLFGSNQAQAELDISIKNRNKRTVYIYEGNAVAREKPRYTPTGFSIKTHELSFIPGYRQGKLDWNIGLPDNAVLPNVLSELEWEEMDIAQLSINGALKLSNQLRFGLDLDMGVIYDGTGRDSDYLFDNRQGEFSRSVFNVDGHDIVNVSAYAGREISKNFGDDRAVSFTPMLGYSYHAQNIQFEEGVQVISTPGLTPNTGEFDGLDSEYRTNWYGPWFGFELGYTDPTWALKTRLSHHRIDYDAEATWNLRTDFAQPKSFEHLSEGEGNRLSVSVSHHWYNNWSANLYGGIESWRVEPGVDRVFFSNGAVASTQLNEVNWESWWIGIGLSRQFN